MLNIKLVAPIFGALLFLLSCQPNMRNETKLNHTYLIYENNDLGLSKIENKWQLKVWAPASDSVKINIYESYRGSVPAKSHLMEPEGSVWIFQEVLVAGMYYDLQFFKEGAWSQKTVDPYCKIASANGKRGFFGLPSSANPAGWAGHSLPVSVEPLESVIYELNIRDFSIDSTSGCQHRGKYLAFTERGTEYAGVKTGLDHLVELGVTHVHLLPFFDFKSIDEENPDDSYNWGYEPYLYNLPEGSFATEVSDPYTRIRETKEMIIALHESGIKVVMDVVYNHTSAMDNHPFGIIAPNYYYRQDSVGSFTNGSACGNEVATERFMTRKFIIESLLYWQEEYRIDGFRFDLMGLHDIRGMNMIADALREKDPSILLYGEGWLAGPSPLPDSARAIKANASRLQQIAVFSDEMRDGLKGHFSNEKHKGFVSGNNEAVESVKFGIVGGIRHPQIDYLDVNYSDKPWSRAPDQMIGYVSCHDDLTLWDKLKKANPSASDEQLIKMSLLANTIVLTSQSIPFLHAGVDFLRTKYDDDNSFESPDAVNSLKWDQKLKYYDVFELYRDLISLRKEHPAFGMKAADIARQSLTFDTVPGEDAFIAYKLGPHANGDNWEWIHVYFNGSARSRSMQTETGEWRKVFGNGKVYPDGISLNDKSISIPPYSAQIIFR